MPQIVLILGGIVILAVVLALMTFQRLICICQPNEALIFSGSERFVGKQRVGYQLVIGGRKMRIPLFERVDRMDLTNMIIDVTATNAYSRGGIPLTVHGVANIKVSGSEPIINNAIERFLGKSRREIISIGKATLEGALRGVLATMTPEQVNEDKLLFAEQLVKEAEHDMTGLGLVIDTIKIQNVADETGYLDSLGRVKNAEITRRARIAEALAQSEAVVQDALNREQAMRAKISAETDVARADAQKRVTDARTQRGALVAEEEATVAAQVAQAKAEVAVQTARVIQVEQKLLADVIAPARAALKAAEERARAAAAPVIEDGSARAEVFAKLADSWNSAGSNARDLFLLQKLNPVVAQITASIGQTRIENVTMIDSGAPTLGNGSGSLPVKLISTLEQFKQVLGVDLLAAAESKGLLTGRGADPGGAPRIPST